MEDNSLIAWGWGCLSIVAIAAVSGLIYYNITAPSSIQLSYEFKEKKLEFQQKMVKEHGASPAVLECLDRDWDNVSVYQICKEVLGNHKLSREEAERLVNKIRELDG